MGDREERLVRLVAFSIEDTFRRGGTQVNPDWVRGVAVDVVETLDRYRWLALEPLREAKHAAD